MTGHACAAFLFFAIGCGGAQTRAIDPGAAGARIACIAGGDTDQDGVSDACELAIATSFAPALVVARRACNWDPSVGAGRVGGEYYFAVQRLDSQSLRIAYLPAYYEDCGWRGFKCNQPFVPCEGHSGDSEFIALDVVRAGDDIWQTSRVFLSAHCFDKLDHDCRWFDGDDLRQFEWDGAAYTAPVIWVADGKGANYPSRRACDRGHLFYDTCDRNDVRMRYPILSTAQNAGSAFAPSGERDGCVSGRHAGVASAKVAPDARECFWNPASQFQGWQRPAHGSSTPYDRYLREIARF